MVEQEWFPDKQIDSFGTNTKENTARGDFFPESSDKVLCAAEPAAMQDGKLKPECKPSTWQPSIWPVTPSICLSLVLVLPPQRIIHRIRLPFCKYCVSDKIRELVADLGWKDPAVAQSVYNFKRPVLGGVVHSHRDSTFLYTTPKQSYSLVFPVAPGPNSGSAGQWLFAGKTKVASRSCTPTVQTQSRVFKKRRSSRPHNLSWTT